MQRSDILRQGTGEVKQGVATALKIRIEAMFLANLLVGGNGSGQVVIEGEASPEDNIESFLLRMSAGYPKLQEAILDRKTGRLSEHLSFIVNGTPLGIRHTPDSPISDVDTIAFVYATCGGI